MSDQRFHRLRFSWRWPIGIFDPQHFSAKGHRGYRWPLVFRMNRFDWAWRNCL
jgi:hypothetical protein